ncbi:MAG: hypothetical protein WCV62_00345 [Candidatus Peribacteraceae bacterium]|jgi:hypothetical protein
MIRLVDTPQAAAPDIVSRFLSVSQRLQSREPEVRRLAEQERRALIGEMTGANGDEVQRNLDQQQVFDHLHWRTCASRNGIVRLGDALNEALAMTPEPMGKTAASMGEATGRVLGGTIGGIGKGIVMGIVRVFKPKK